jgi:hypothetical protein
MHVVTMSNVLGNSSLQQSDTSMLQSTDIDTDKTEPLISSSSDEIDKALLPSAFEDSILQHNTDVAIQKTTSVEQPITKRSITMSSTDDASSINKSTSMKDNQDEANETSSATIEGNNNNEVVLTFPQRVSTRLYCTTVERVLGDILKKSHAIFFCIVARAKSAKLFLH